MRVTKRKESDNEFVYDTVPVTADWEAGESCVRVLGVCVSVARLNIFLDHKPTQNTKEMREMPRESARDAA